MLAELKPYGNYDAEVLQRAQDALQILSQHLKERETSYVVTNRIGLLDALADQIVTATGVGTFFGMNVPGALAEVNRSNYSKFVDGEPLFDENQKIIKGPDYIKPDLAPYI